MRLFFALWPPRETARALAEWALAIQQGAGGRVAKEDNIHLTLAFLGDADLGKASAAAEPVRCNRFDLPIDTAKYWKHNRIVWVGPAVLPAALSGMVEKLHDSLKEKGFVLEERPFAAHVTLVRRAALPGRIPPLPRIQWPVDEFVLVESRNGRYEVLERYPL
ncbi:MAG TPA: RNA 2',3'-cyclic phosphodiesterase [Burkholderiales bacterium]|nr:RNA 2',3'-cyclic phosphodiesterase [Burkholderiales bacterium]